MSFVDTKHIALLLSAGKKMSNHVLTENIGGKLVVTFDRPAVRSPLSIGVLEELRRILDGVADGRSVIFTGRENVFASGADLREIAQVTEETAGEFALRGQRLMNLIAAKNSIAAINGFCFGGALDLALACRKRFASANAQFSHPGANLGIMTGWGGTQRLPRLVGEARALEMFLTAKRLSAEEALRIGLIDEIAENPLALALKY
jgi:enoyl-CoA hydratase/carnithine racemase